jgi:error-prone DNA polymerase
MPEIPPSKRREPLQPSASPHSSIPVPHFAELHCKTNFSFLEGASHPDELVQQAAELGYRALAITDNQSLAGVVRAHAAAKAVRLKLLIGAEIAPIDAPPIVLLAPDRAAYGRLSRLLSVGRLRAEKGECRLQLADVAEHAAGLLACVLSDRAGDARELFAYREIFADRAYALVELQRGADDRLDLETMLARSRQARLPVAAAGDVHYHVPERRALHDVLTAIRAGCTVAEAGERLFVNGERHLQPPAEMAARFADVPGALARTVEIADRCRFSLDELRYEYPEELCPAGVTPAEYLARLTWQGAAKRYPGGVPDKVREQLTHELAIIDDLHYEAYFLTVWDLVRFARGRGILCQGRGSAANSAVCYVLGVTAVDPDRTDLLFERFISRERNEAPDIDLDFEHERREEVLQYLYDKYGRERAGMTAEVISYRPRSAVRDVGKSLGLSLDRVDALAKSLDSHRHEGDWSVRLRDAGLDPQAPVVRQMLALVNQLLGFPRHLSQHVGGMVMTEGPLCELVPIENASMPGRTVIQWDKDDLDELGILKVDCLALGMLTAIRKCFALVETHHHRKLTLASVPQDDADVYEMACRADTIGVFQIESRAQMSMLPRLKPRTFYDLVIEVSLVRPGPIQGNMVHPYLRRRSGVEEVTYPNEAIRQVLEKTLGVPIFQEQAMRLAVVAAGFTPGEADQLRRAMGAWRRPGLMDQFRQKLTDGMLTQGHTVEYAQQVFRQISGFGEYGFPESHAASFALLVYVSAWLKYHYPDAFCAAIVNSQPMGFYSPAQLVRDAREHGIEVRAIDVNSSAWDCTLESISQSVSPGEPEALAPGVPPPPLTPPPRGTMRLGLRLVRGLPYTAALAVMAAREQAPFRSWSDFSRRTGLRRPALVKLAQAGALDSLGLDRRRGLWQALEQPPESERPLLAGLDEDQPPAELPRLSAYEEVLADYRQAGLTLRTHPIAFFRPQLDALGCVPSQQLASLTVDRVVRVAGLVLVRQRPATARGLIFMTIEDETGVANLIVKPDVWQRYHRIAGGASALIAQGRLQREGQVIHILLQSAHELPQLASKLKSVSRDFH